jgi:cytochrome c-type biogenesis protein CcmH/NrfG
LHARWFKAKRRTVQKPSPPLFQQGLAAAESGDFARADAIARGLLSRDPNDVHALQILGFCAFRQGRNDEALQAFVRANRAAPGQPPLLYWLGVLFKERGDFAQAERAFGEAVRLNPQYGEAWCHLGETLYLVERIGDASAAYDRAILSEPESVTVIAKCARFRETIHDLQGARELAEKAHALDPQDELSAIALGEIRLRQMQPDEALDGLEPFLSQASTNDRNRAKILHLTATALDRKGRYAESFLALEESHTLQRKINAPRATSTPSPLNSETLDRTIEFLRETHLAEWTQPENLEGPDPVFLLGFVRSGTTWLDQILSSHPKIAVMEEEDNFIDIWPRLIRTTSSLKQLQSYSSGEINECRRKYWSRASRLATAPTGGFIIDKVPLNTVQLGLIYRLFAKAKIIFALRDPRDAILSAFQQHFQINAGMVHFLDIKTAASFYDKTMTIAELVRSQISLNIHEVRYESVVQDFQPEIMRLVNFLGLPWDDAVLNYQATARSRAVRTPSRQQVVQPPYATSIGKWRNYRNELAPALPLLEPWIEKFGYDQD